MIRRPVVLLLALATCARADGESEAARAQLREVLLRDEFRPLTDRHRIDLPELHIEGTWIEELILAVWEFVKDVFGAIGDVLGSILKQLFGGLRGLFGGAGAAGGVTTSGVVTWVVAAAALALLVYLAVRMGRAVGAERRAAGVLVSAGTELDAEEDALARAPEDWRREAERLAATGRRAEALRALYLELLAGLHRVGAIDYDRTRTNTAYVRDVPRTHAAFEPFHRLTLRFDQAVYGRREPTDADVRAAVSEVEAVRRAFAAGVARVS